MMSDLEEDRLKRFGGKEWTNEIPSVLDEPNISLVQAAIEIDWVFGLHMIYYGATSPIVIAFKDLGRYLPYVRAARAGDKFLLWSIHRLREAQLLLAEKTANAEVGDVADAIAISERYLSSPASQNRSREVVALCLPSDSDELRIIVNDIDILSELPEFLDAANGPGGRWCLIPFSDIDPDSDRSAHQLALIDAKRPDALGAVPIGGCY